MKNYLYAAAAVAALVPAAAMAQGKEISGTTASGLSWKAKSLIIGQDSTATVAGGGNDEYLAHDNAKYNGVVQLRMQYATGAFVCSGSLMTNGRILTAAHCISGGYDSNVNGRDAALLSTTAYFYSGSGQGFDPVMFGAGGVPNAGVTAVAVGGYSTHYGYTGDVVDQNDIAILTLAQAAPLYAARYDIHTGGLTGQDFNVAGYGLRSLTGGVDGYGNGQALGTGRLREGDNTYDYRLGDPYFGNFWTGPYGPNRTNIFGGTAEIDYSYVSDFDNGTAEHDSNCINFGLCDLGLGEREVSIAGGDSGGPGFINGRIASVNSYGFTFGIGGGDDDDELNSSWGEYAGYVPTFIHSNWIAGVPEPSTWAMLILGFGVAGASMRRKNKAQARYAF